MLLIINNLNLISVFLTCGGPNRQHERMPNLATFLNVMWKQFNTICLLVKNIGNCILKF